MGCILGAILGLEQVSPETSCEHNFCKMMIYFVHDNALAVSIGIYFPTIASSVAIL